MGGAAGKISLPPAGPDNVLVPFSAPSVHSMDLRYDREYTAANPACTIPLDWWHRSIPVDLRSSSRFSLPDSNRVVTSSHLSTEGVTYEYQTKNNTIMHPAQLPPRTTLRSPAAQRTVARSTSFLPPTHVICPFVRTTHFIDGFSQLEKSWQHHINSTPIDRSSHANQRMHGGANLLQLLHGDGGDEIDFELSIEDTAPLPTRPSRSACHSKKASITSFPANLMYPLRRSILHLTVPSLSAIEAFQNPLQPTEEELCIAFSNRTTLQTDRYDTSRVIMTNPGEHCVRAVNIHTGGVSHVAGLVADDALRRGRSGGDSDGNGISQAQFNSPSSAVAIEQGVWIVSDTMNHTVRRVVETEAVKQRIKALVSSKGSSWSGAKLFQPAAVAPATSRSPSDVSEDDFPSNQHELLDNILEYLGNDVSTVAGGNSGKLDGVGFNARFCSPKALTYSTKSRFVYIVDSENNSIRIMDPYNYSVQTLRIKQEFLRPAAQSESSNSWGSSAIVGFDEPEFQFSGDLSLNFDGYNSSSDEDVLILSSAQCPAVFEMRVSPESSLKATIRWIAGGRWNSHDPAPRGQHNHSPPEGYADGTATRSRFGKIASSCVDSLSGDIALCDSTFNVIRLIKRLKDGEPMVYTIAGNARQSGSVDGMDDASRLDGPLSIVACLCDLHGGSSVTSLASPSKAVSSSTSSTPSTAIPLSLHSMYVFTQSGYECGVRKVYVCDCVPFEDNPVMLPSFR